MTKRLIALLLAMCLMLSLAACGSKNEETTTDEPAVEEEAPLPEEEDVVIESEVVDPEADVPAAPEEEQEPAVEMPSVDAEVEVKPEETPVVTPEVEAPAAGSVDLNAFYEAFALAQGEDNWPFMMLAEGEMLDGFFPGLTGIATKQCYAYLPAMSAVAAEFVLVEVENASDIEAVKAIMQARIDAQVAGGAWYPETIEGWKTNSRIVTNGNHIVMAVFSDVDAFVSEFNGPKPNWLR